MTQVQAPPEAEFDALADLFDKQRDDLGDMASYARSTCANTDGLANALSFLQGPVVDLATFMDDKLVHSRAGIADTAGRLRDAGTAYARADASAEARITASFPATLPGFPEIPGGPAVGSYTDISIDLATPDDADDVLKANLDHVMSALGTVEHVWRWVTGGDSLIERLVTPIMGNYGRLKYLQQAYDCMGDAGYAVAGNLRRGTYRIAPQWNGTAATEFEYWMFRWHMGIGGLGDLAKVASTVFRDGYLTVSTLVQAVLDAIGVFINHEIKQLLQALAGSALIEAIGGGPEDPVADVVAAGWDAWKIYKAVSYAITAINLIVKLIDKVIEGAKQLAHDITGLVDLLHQTSKDPAAMARTMLDQGLNRGLEIEKDKFWDTRFGATRIAMLP